MNKQALFELIEKDLQAVEAELYTITHSPVTLLTDLSSHLIQAGGKRLRPALYLLCAYGTPLSDAGLSIATSIELIHMATLVHDDVIDESSTRRGIPTANAKWGNLVSVLSGDYLFAKAFSLIADRCDGRIMKVLADVVCSMCEGEILQNQTAYNVHQTEDDYYARIAKKTADFIAASCELGAISRGMDEAEVAMLRHYGYSLGMAFQMTDDILDVTATAGQLGKPAGNDLRQGIITFPVIHALKVSPARDELKQLILSGNMSDQDVTRSLEIVHDTCGVEEAYKIVDGYLEQAVGSLPNSLPANLTMALAQITHFVGVRQY